MSFRCPAKQLLARVAFLFPLCGCSGGSDPEMPKPDEAPDEHESSSEGGSSEDDGGTGGAETGEVLDVPPDSPCGCADDECVQPHYDGLGYDCVPYDGELSECEVCP